MVKGIINSIASLLLFMLLIQCKKDNDAAPPIVIISSPHESQAFGVYDTFTIKADISDDKQLISINIKLLNEQQAVMQEAVTFTISGNKFSLERKYTLYDVYLPTGYYYLRIEASDGSNVGVGYVKIYVHETPTVRRAIYAITQTSSTLNVVQIDSALNAVNMLSFNSDYSGSGISSYYQYLYVSGNYTGSVKGIDVQSNVIKWSVDPQVSGNQNFTSVYTEGNRTYVSYYSGFVKAFDHYGTSIYQTQMAPDGFYPIKVIANGDHVLVEIKDKTSTSRKLITYLASTGLGTQEKYFDKVIVDFVARNSNEVFIFSNNAGQGSMELFYITSNSFYIPHLIPAGKIWSAVQIDGDNYLIGHDDGNIYRYQYSQNSLTTLITGVKAYKMRYDVVNNQLIIADAKSVKLYNYSPSITTLANTVFLADTILDVHVLFNK